MKKLPPVLENFMLDDFRYELFSEEINLVTEMPFYKILAHIPEDDKQGMKFKDFMLKSIELANAMKLDLEVIISPPHRFTTLKFSSRRFLITDDNIGIFKELLKDVYYFTIERVEREWGLDICLSLEYDTCEQVIELLKKFDKKVFLDD